LAGRMRALRGKVRKRKVSLRARLTPPSGIQTSLAIFPPIARIVPVSPAGSPQSVQHFGS
jgi:hypothetical protein